MCRLASEYTGVEVRCEKIQDWLPQEKYDGIWANASLLHLPIEEIEEFICRAQDYLNAKGGAVPIHEEGDSDWPR